MAPAGENIGAIERIAAECGVAVVVVDASAAEVRAANNNSICAHLYPSPEFGAACADHCGGAYRRAVEAGGPVDYECHAGLACRAFPLGSEKSPLVAIVGRAFQKSENYRRATERAASGDWRRFRPADLFDNVIISGSPDQLEKVAAAVAKVDVPGPEAPIAASPSRKRKTEPAHATPAETKAPDPFETSLLNYKLELDLPDETNADPFETSLVNARVESPGSGPFDQEMADREAWRAFIPSLLKVSYRLACRRILEFLSRHYGIESSLWLQREGSHFELAAVLGDLEDKPVRIEIPVDDKRIRAAVRDDSPILLREAQAAGNRKPRVIQLFPVVIGGEVRNALGVGREAIDPDLAGRILKFCRYVASRLEILRLREAVSRQERTSRVMREFNEQLRNVDSDNFWMGLTDVSARLVSAERASLLVRGPAEKLIPKAAIGNRVDLSVYHDLGSRVARTILEMGKPALIPDVAKASLAPAEEDRRYKSNSFISYPITLGGMGIGVMNFTDKTGGEQFSKFDLEVLDSIAPQIAVALDRVMLREKVGEFAQLSVTDPLTGLLNRRYIEERLAEEINRSDRTGEPLSFLMIDVDEFKSYNDRFGHPAGDEALRIVGSILKQNLRGADVAVRYGGEEFSVLLPATTTEEALVIADRIRRHIERTEFPKRKVTISIGIASRSPSLTTVTELISAADQALFRAKKNGRNNAQVYDPVIDVGENVH